MRRKEITLPSSISSLKVDTYFSNRRITRGYNADALVSREVEVAHFLISSWSFD